MNDIVEKVAWAINPQADLDDTAGHTIGAFAEAKRQARAAILATLEALKEPTEGMVMAGEFTYAIGEANETGVELERAFRAMIEAAQKEGGK